MSMINLSHLFSIQYAGLKLGKEPNLIDDVQCYQTVRELRWSDGVRCPSCESQDVIKRGFDDTESARQRYECHDCDKRFVI